MANSKPARLATPHPPCRCSSPFADIDLPVALIQNDELSIPVAVYNYLDQPQELEIGWNMPGLHCWKESLKRTIQIAAQE